MKKRMTLLDTRCEVSAVTNWALVLIHESAVSPVSPAMRRARRSARSRSCSARSMLDTPPTRSSRLCAVRRPT